MLLVKTFQDLRPDEPAQGEAEVQVYVNRGKSYIELESQGPCRQLQPGDELSWTVRWYVAPAADAPQPSQKLLRQVRQWTD